MKTEIIAGSIAVLAALFVGCSKKEDDVTLHVQRKLHVYEDADTGCQYINFGGGGVTPRMNGSKQMGCKEQ